MNRSSPTLRLAPRPTPGASIRPAIPRPRRQPSRPNIAPASSMREALEAVAAATAQAAPTAQAAQAAPTEDAVLSFLAKLAPDALDALVARARAAAPVEAAPPRATLPSADLELVAELVVRKSTPPPLPARATTPPPKPEETTTTEGPTATATATSSAPPPPPALSAPDLTDLLFDAMTDLPFFDTAVEGGAFCLSSVLRVLPSLAGMVSLFDADERELVVVYAQGPRSERLLLTRFSAADALVRAAFDAGAPVVVSYDGAEAPSERHAAFGEPWSVLVAPVVRDGRLLGTIELVDPIDGTPFDVRAHDALRYVASRWAELIAERGIRLPRLVAPPVEDVGDAP